MLVGRMVDKSIVEDQTDIHHARLPIAHTHTLGHDMTDTELKTIARGLLWDDQDKQTARDLLWSDNNNN